MSVIEYPHFGISIVKSVTSRIFKALWRKKKTGHSKTVIKETKKNDVINRKMFNYLTEMVDVKLSKKGNSYYQWH